MTTINENDYRAQVAYILNDIEIKEDHIFLKSQGKSVPYFKGNQQYASDLPKKLSDAIYEHYYCKGTYPEEISPETYPDKNFRQEVIKFVEQLSASNTCAGGFNRSWTIEEKGGQGQVSVSKNGYRRTVSPGAYVVSSNLFSEADRQEIDLASPKEKFSFDKGFYFVFGDAEESEDYSFLVRFYFNLKADKAQDLVQLLSQILNENLIPFQFKCLYHPDLYTRADAAVLYISKSYADFVARLLQEQTKELKDMVKPGIPLFTYPFLPGIGFAESPLRPDISFGQSRADALSKAALLYRESAPEEKVGQVTDRLTGSNFDLSQLWKNPFTSYPYSFIA